MTPPTEKPFEPTPEQVEEVSNKLAWYLATDVCPKLRQMVEWQLVQTEKVRESMRLKGDCIESMSSDLSTLRSQLDAMNQEVQVEISFKVQAREQSESLKLKVEELRGVILTLHSQLDALKAEVARKDEAIQRFLDEFGSEFCECRNTSSPLMDGKEICDYCFGRKALTPAAMEANKQ